MHHSARSYDDRPNKELNRRVIARKLIHACGSPDFASKGGIHRYFLARDAKGEMTDPSNPQTASHLQLAEPRPVTETRDIPSSGPGGGDRTAAVIRSVISNIPIVGQALAEVITELVPNQRVERVEKYLLYLSEEIDSLKVENVDAVMKRPENVDLIEDGVYQAIRALSDERKRYLVRAVAQGIGAEARDKLNEKRVLALIGDLDDSDLLLLDAFASGNKGREKFEN